MLAFAFAYLVVAQAALVGVSHHAQANPGDTFALILCDGGVAPGEPGKTAPHQPMACCGVGCLVGGQLSPLPGGSAAVLRRPAMVTIRAAAEREAPRAERAGAVATRPRGPPSIG